VLSFCQLPDLPFVQTATCVVNETYTDLSILHVAGQVEHISDTEDMIGSFALGAIGSHRKRWATNDMATGVL